MTTDRQALIDEIKTRANHGDYSFALDRTELWRKGQELLLQKELETLRRLFDEWLQKHKDIHTLIELLSSSTTHQPALPTLDEMEKFVEDFMEKRPSGWTDRAFARAILRRISGNQP